MKFININKDAGKLKKMIDIKNFHISCYEADLVQKDNDISILKQKNKELKEDMRVKNERIADVYKDLHKLQEENEGYYDTITQIANENLELHKENERLKNAINVGVIAKPLEFTISYKEPKVNVNELAEAVQSNLTRVNGQKPHKEHECTVECFKEHVLPAIQKDYDSINTRYLKEWYVRYKFLEHWRKKIMKEYSFIEHLYGMCGTIMVTFK